MLQYLETNLVYFTYTTQQQFLYIVGTYNFKMNNQRGKVVYIPKINITLN